MDKKTKEARKKANLEEDKRINKLLLDRYQYKHLCPNLAFDKEIEKRQAEDRKKHK